MGMKRILVEDLDDGAVKEIPDDAYAYVDPDFKLLKHHTDNVLNGMEEFSVDENLLSVCISMARDILPFEDDTRKNVLEHLLMHKNQLIKSKTPTENCNSTVSVQHNKKPKKYIPADVLVNLVSALIPGEELANEDAAGSVASIVDREAKENSIIWYLRIRTNAVDTAFVVPVEMQYSAAGDLEFALIYGSKVPEDLCGEIQKFISKAESLL